MFGRNVQEALLFHLVHNRNAEWSLAAAKSSPHKTQEGERERDDFLTPTLLTTTRPDPVLSYFTEEQKNTSSDTGN